MHLLFPLLVVFASQTALHAFPSDAPSGSQHAPPPPPAKTYEELRDQWHRLPKPPQDNSAPVRSALNLDDWDSRIRKSGEEVGRVRALRDKAKQDAEKEQLDKIRDEITIAPGEHPTAHDFFVDFHEGKRQERLREFQKGGEAEDEHDPEHHNDEHPKLADNRQPGTHGYYPNNGRPGANEYRRNHLNRENGRPGTYGYDPQRQDGTRHQDYPGNQNARGSGRRGRGRRY